ncbi:MAG: MBL fold metallo-hydrolase [Proteobacteria bacterium]|nr:MBL fold metallo-hydrolase [Pseudomonadota bacterium]
MTPDHSELWFLPLGGCGEIGMNLNLFGHNGHWLMVDCGVTFEQGEGGNRVQMPNPEFIVEHRDKLVGLIATHAHQDHIGAIHLLWQQFRCPIYATRFTAHVITAKLRREGCPAIVKVVDQDASLNLGPFSVQWLPITHSTAETSALLINTAVGSILHTADWKVDHQPVVGRAFEDQCWQELGTKTIDAIVCDSTNATETGHSLSESDLLPGLQHAIAEAPSRVVVACFASNIARLQTIGNAAAASGRYLAILGRSLIDMVASAKASGYLLENFDVIPTHDIGYLPPEEILIVATGSQGEPNAALNRLARGTHPELELDPLDRVVFSSKTIPGNELAIQQLFESLRARGVDVVEDAISQFPIHASGHPCADELQQMYQWVDSSLAIPVHGEPKHLAANAAIAKNCGVAQQLTGLNGDLFRIRPTPGVYRQAVATGRLELLPNGKLAAV